MKLTRTIGALLATTALLLAGCGEASTVDSDTTTAATQTAATPEPTTVEPTSAEETTAEETTTEETTEDSSGDLLACNLIFNRDADGTSVAERIPDALLSIGPSLGGETLDELLAIDSTLGLAASSASEPLATQITTLKEPFQQVSDVVFDGGGQLAIDTSHITTDIATVMETCTAAGYTANY